MAEVTKTGGKVIELEGSVDYMQAPKTNQNTGQTTVGVRITYWGDSDFIRIDASQANMLRQGSWVKVRGNYAQFKDRESGEMIVFIGDAHVIELEGKPVAQK